ncbi:MAG: DsbE family thiol:disulfide interchange protein [Alphaproteobacteria bacterium]|nr:DsbE family thiol:disulfide interchange protein [Alphaproteobacteria bacterium]MBU0796318.1 DsbE family thiol:disulfide interchange protein [Alphaproteobacteria bacterium]MBU0889165.1 DsbE family thiol:disulfide interchange protein [Alphaproteobacteria bacterium]MBU1812199.1 DsbE family thiol:disulfide interchange protein [Alphaproteobacteria bacterium]
MTRRLVYLLPLVLFLGVVAYFAVGLTRDPQKLPSTMIDRPAPEFALPPLLDSVPGLATADLKGQVALVNVFASWCAPCRVEHPILTGLARDGVTIFGINQKDKPEPAKRFLANLGNPYTRVGVDADGRASIDWGVYGVPETYVIDREGHVRYRHVGALTARDVSEKIRPMLRELSR